MLTQTAGDGAPVIIAEIAMGRTLNVDGKLQPPIGARSPRRPNPITAEIETPDQGQEPQAPGDGAG
jgi:hypothetical protein